MRPRTFPIILVALIVAIAVVNGFAEIYHWYWRMRWFDMPMHFAGGMWLAGVALWWYLPPLKKGAINFSKVFAVCFAAALGVGVAWEIYGAVVSFAMAGHINAKSDTLKDLLFDTIGGMMVAILVWVRMNLKQK